MNERPSLDIKLDSKTFKEYYYLKEELIDFCRKNRLQTTGGKLEITERISEFLDTGKRTYKSNPSKKTKNIDELHLDTVIEENFVCSERHRAFYKEQIGKSFSFNVAFQKWLKSNAGKTYQDSINAYNQILEDKKKNKTIIDRQFEYNTYIRDFFNDNKDKNLDDAIKCWKYKKSLKGSHKYTKEDLSILEINMKKMFLVVTLICLLLATGCSKNDEIVNSNSNMQKHNSHSSTFVSGMGCSNNDCTDSSHHHDCQPDCQDYEHHHNCDLDCQEESHHHHTTSKTSESAHHQEQHHGNTHH